MGWHRLKDVTSDPNFFGTKVPGFFARITPKRIPSSLSATKNVDFNRYFSFYLVVDIPLISFTLLFFGQVGYPPGVQFHQAATKKKQLRWCSGRSLCARWWLATQEGSWSWNMMAPRICPILSNGWMELVWMVGFNVFSCVRLFLCCEMRVGNGVDVGRVLIDMNLVVKIFSVVNLRYSSINQTWRWLGKSP